MIEWCHLVATLCNLVPWLLRVEVDHISDDVSGGLTGGGDDSGRTIWTFCLGNWWISAGVANQSGLCQWEDLGWCMSLSQDCISIATVWSQWWLIRQLTNRQSFLCRCWPENGRNVQSTAVLVWACDVSKPLKTGQTFGMSNLSFEDTATVFRKSNLGVSWHFSGCRYRARWQLSGVSLTVAICLGDKCCSLW